MTTQPLSWLKQIQNELSASKQIPLWGHPPDFPLEEFSIKLQESLDLSFLQLCIKNIEELNPATFLSSLGENPSIACFELAPLPGMLYFTLSLESLQHIIPLLLTQKSATPPPSDPNLREGFYQYVLLKIADCLDHIGIYPDLRVQWLEKKPLPKMNSFAFDLEIKLEGSTFQARLILSPEFHKSFASHFSSGKKELSASLLKEEIDVEIRLEMGSTTVSQKEWKSIKKGDFLILDRCSYDPMEHKGILTLCLQKTPLFKVKLKKDKLKILDYYTYKGDSIIMDEEMDLDPFEEESTNPELSEEEMDGEESPSFEEPPLALSEEVSLPIIVEAARTHINLQSLLELKPGNVLDLSVRPEDGVYLTLHGKKIAKGELIKLGDTLGVRVIEIGETSSS